jgi:hypothetical protein
MQFAQEQGRGVTAFKDEGTVSCPVSMGLYPTRLILKVSSASANSS